MSQVLVFPSAFFGKLKNLIDPRIAIDRQAILEQAHETVSVYDEQVWGSSLILIPANFEDHWVLLAVCNAREAAPATNVPPPAQLTTAGDDEPDVNRFCMLSLNSLENTPRRITRILKMYLDYSYRQTFGVDLQFVKAWVAQVKFSSARPIAAC